MYTIHIDEIKPDTTENIEIWVSERRCITISLNHKNMSIEMPTTINLKSVNFGNGSFFLRTPDRG